MRSIFIIIILVLLPILSFCQNEQTFIGPSLHYNIENSFSELSLPNLTWVLEANNETLTKNDLISGNYKDANPINLNESPVFDIKSHTSYWAHIQLTSKIDRDTFGITFTPNGNAWPWEFTFRNVEAHIYNKGDKIRTGYSGTAIPFSKRDFSEKIDPSLIWVKINAKDTLDIWLELEMAERVNAEIQVELISKEFASLPRPANFLFSSHHFLNGVSFALLILALALFIWFRDSIYWWFMIFQIFLLLSIGFGEFVNEVYLMFFKETPRSLLILSTYFTLFRILSVLQFGKVYIGTKEKFPKIHRLINISMILLSILTFLGTSLRTYPNFLGLIGVFWVSNRQIIIGLNFLLILYILFYLSFSKDKFARVFASGILITFIATLGRLIIINIYDSPGESLVSLLNQTFLVITMTIILAYRFVNITQEKQVAQEEKIASDLEKIKQEQLAEQKTKEAERLEELDKIKSNFFSNITHEFRTPLTLIIEPLKQVLEQPEKPWTSKVQLAKNNSQKLLQLINQLLDLSKLESNKMQLEYKRGNITDLINPMIDSFSLMAKEKGIRLNYIQKNQIPSFDFDVDKMEKVFSNLISNAIKFTANNGIVTVGIESKELNDITHFFFSIQDNGIGVSYEEQQSIFDRFYQVDGSNTRKQQGTGIGLSLCKELVDLMDGDLTLESQLGEGSHFKVTIPMINKVDEKERPSENIEYIQHTTSNQDVVFPINKEINIEADNLALIVEDNAELRQFIRSSIEDKYQVIEAKNGKEGLAKALEYIPNIIISDVMMPEMDGFELCNKVKTNLKTAHIPLILLTAKTNMDSRIQGLEYGADVYMNKPFSTKELLLQMKNLIEVRRMLQQKFSQQLDGSAILNPNTKTDKEQENIESTPNIISTFDEEFLTNINTFIDDNIQEENLTVEALAKEMLMSRTQLFRKLKGLLNQSPTEFIRNYRLKKAKELLEAKKGNITEIAFMVGFSNQKYFSTKFKEKYGLSPNQI